MVIKDWILDKWITWRTGKDRAQREWEAWYEENVDYRASNIPTMFRNFKHVIEVNPDKFFNPHEPFAWVPNEDAKQYFWPKRKLGENCVWRFERVSWTNWLKCWYIDEMGGGDHVFVATNSDKDAMMIALKYMS